MEGEGLEPLLCRNDFGLPKSFDLAVTHDSCSFFASTTVADSLFVATLASRPLARGVAAGHIHQCSFRDGSPAPGAHEGADSLGHLLPLLEERVVTVG